MLVVMRARSRKTASGVIAIFYRFRVGVRDSESREGIREIAFMQLRFASGAPQDGMEELAEYDAFTTARVARYDHDPSRIDALLGQTAAGGKAHAVTDALGSVYGFADNDATEVTQYGYDVYGARTAIAEAVPTKWGFTGRVHEKDAAGAMYYRARYLDTEVGRFTRPDPARKADGLNKYWYAVSNPVVFIDALGLYVVYVIAIKPRPETEKEYGKVPHFLEGLLLDRAIAVARSRFGNTGVFVDLENDGSAIQRAADDAEARGIYIAAHGGSGILEKKGGIVCPSGFLANDSACSPAVKTHLPKPFRQIAFTAIAACDSEAAREQWQSAFGNVADLKLNEGDCGLLCALSMAYSFLKWTESQEFSPGLL